MLKKFLKFLKGASREHEIEGSYLEHLLDQVRPRLDAEMKRCPEHDPLLVVVAEILRLSRPEYWSEDIACPLTDDQSPPLAAAEPPPAPPELPEEGFEIVETSEVIDEAAEDDAAVDDATEDDAAEADAAEADAAADDAAADDAAVDEEVEEEEGQGDAAVDDRPTDSSDEDDEAPEAEADADEQADPLSADEQDDVPAPADEDITLEVEEAAYEAADTEESDLVPLDSPEVLQAGRVFLGLLIENDRLPLDMQLSIAETMLARDLLLGYFVHDGNFEPKAQELLSLIEQKFNAGAFSQARILLQLFQTDRSTRINNDRNLFYEDMILRLGIRRRHALDHGDLADFDAVVSGDDVDTNLAQASRWLHENLHVDFHLFTRHIDEVDAWRKLASRSRRERAEQIFLRYLPPKRWRPVHASDLSGSEMVTSHVSASTLKTYILRQLKTCFFVLRAVGDTGLEPFLDVFFDWTEEAFDINSVGLLPLIYRRTMSDTQLIDKIFEGVFDEFFKNHSAQYLASFDREAILEATRKTLASLPALDFDQIPAGNYDLGGLILDRLFGIEYHHPEFAFKLHRLT